MKDVIADAGVDGDGNREAVSGGEEAEIAMGKITFRNAAADIFAEAEIERGGFGDPRVELAGLAPEAEFAGLDVAFDGFGGGADAGELVIVNGAGAVDGEVSDVAAFEEIEQMAMDAGAKDMGAHHQDFCAARVADASGERGEIGVIERRSWVIEREPVGEREIVLAGGEGLEAEAGAVEDGIFRQAKRARSRLRLKGKERSRDFGVA